MSDFLPFALPDIGEDEIAAVAHAMRTGWVSSGPKVNEFEEAFSQFLGGRSECIALNSATAGLHLALEAVGVGPGDEVLLPTWTFTATAEVVRYLGAEPVLVDVDANTLNIDFHAAREKLSDRTRAIIPVHFGGLPVDPDALAKFASDHGLRVVEDAAHAFPARVHDGIVGGGASDATVFSFYATKTMTTGEGGMLVTPDAAVAARVRVMRLHGIDRDAFARYRSDVPAWRYDVVAPGYKYNLTDPAAAMGLVQLNRAHQMVDRRTEIARRYGEAFAQTVIQLPAAAPGGVSHAWHLYVIRLPVGADRDEFINAMAQRGVATSVHFIPLHMHSYWRTHGAHDDADFPVASREFERVVSLPIFSSMSDHDVERVIGAVLATVPR